MRSRPRAIPPCGRRAVLEGLQEEAEALLGLLVGHGQDLEDLRLQRRVVDAEAAAADLGPVQHDVVGLGPHLPGSVSSSATSSSRGAVKGWCRLT